MVGLSDLGYYGLLYPESVGSFVEEESVRLAHVTFSPPQLSVHVSRFHASCYCCCSYQRLILRLEMQPSMPARSSQYLPGIVHCLLLLLERLGYVCCY